MRRSPLTHVLITAARLVAVLAILAVHLAAEVGGDAVAAPYTPHPDFVSVNGFKRDCTTSGGSIETTAGSIACFHENGSVIVCDENAKNCSYFPPSANQQTTPGPFAGADEVANVPLEELAPTSPIEPATGDDVTHVQSGSSSSDSNEIKIYTSLCPSGTDLSEETLQTYQTCSAVEPRPAFAFSISVDGVHVGTVTPDQYGVVTLDGLPTGTITAHVGARSTSDKPVAYCWSYIDGNLELPRVRYNVTDDWSVSVHALDPKTAVECAWYYVQPASGKISIHKYECPAGFNVTGAGPTGLKQACPPSRTPVEFNLTHPDGAYSMYTTATVPSVVFAYRNAGNMTIREVIPPGFGVPIVYCETTRVTASGLMTVHQYDWQMMASVDSIRVTIDTAFDSISCDWFNVRGTLPALSGGETQGDLPDILPAEPTTPPDAMPTETPTETPPPTASATVTPTDEPVIEPTFEPTDAGPWTIPEGTIPVFEPVEPTPTPVILT